MNALQLARPHAIMMVGIPGSGKSFFARQFSDMFKIPYFDFNAIGQLTHDHVSTDELIATLLTEFVKTEQTFIFEGDSLSQDRRTDFMKWSKANGYVPLFVWVQTTPDASRSRALRSGMSPEVFDEQLSQFDPPKDNEKPAVISGRHTYTTQARVVLTHIARLNRPGARGAQVPRTKPATVSPAPRNNTAN